MENLSRIHGRDAEISAYEWEFIFILSDNDEHVLLSESILSGTQYVLILISSSFDLKTDVEWEYL